MSKAKGSSAAHGGGDDGGRPRSPMARGLRRGLLLVVVIVAAAAAVLAVRWLTSAEMMQDPAASIHAEFTLTDQDGRTVTAQDLAGKPMLLYFGYTYCPDVCPTELANISQAMDILGTDADAVQPVHRLGHRAAQLGLPISNVLGHLGRLEFTADKAAGGRHESSSPFKVER